jgi:hypothetical protein
MKFLPIIVGVIAAVLLLIGHLAQSLASKLYRHIADNRARHYFWPEVSQTGRAREYARYVRSRHRRTVVAVSEQAYEAAGITT